MSAQVILPRIMQIGGDSCMQIPSVLETLHCSQPLIITDKMMVQLGYVERIKDLLEKHTIHCDIFDDTIPEPTVQSIQAGIDKVLHGEYDCILALGGGSPIDSAKAISILAKHGGKIHDYKFPRLVNEQGLPVIAIPTTAGTGSEVTRFTIITDESCDEKMLCVGIGFMPVAALIDHKLTCSLPPRITADTGIDALTHAIESYVSKKANPYSDSQALHAMRLIGPNLRKVFHEGSNQKAREAMMLGATMAGIAFSNASVAMVHGMSRPIGAFFHVPHGLSNAMLLPSVTKFSLPAAEERYADCARAMGVACHKDDIKTATNKLIEELNNLNNELEVPTAEAFGINKEKFITVVDMMAEQALASGSPGNNPRVPTAEQMISIYKSLWN